MHVSEKYNTIGLQNYRVPNGRRPFVEWFESIQDKNTQNRIDKRLERLEDGNFGDCQIVWGGFELRLHFGPGYRIYFGQIDDTLVLLLCGGDKTLNDLPTIGRQQLIISKQ